MGDKNPFRSEANVLEVAWFRKIISILRGAFSRCLSCIYLLGGYSLELACKISKFER